MSPIAIYHEHPDWFKPLFEELDNRGIPYTRLNPAAHQFAIEAPAPDYSLFFNRMSPSAYLRDGTQGIFYTLNYLRYLEYHRVPTVNGYKAFVFETSKALQLELMQSLGIAYPKSRVVNHPSKLVEAAEGLRFPVVVKANIGAAAPGSQNIRRWKICGVRLKPGRCRLASITRRCCRNLLPHAGDISPG